MTVSGTIATIYPSSAARDQALWAEAEKTRARGVFPSPAYTIEELLTKLVDRLDLPDGKTALGPLAGALLIQEIIRRPEFADGAYHGLAATWRLPSRLWRLIVEVKAAGLGDGQLGEIPGQGIAGLARIMASYQAALDERGLMDQADRLAWLEEQLERGIRPRSIEGWDGLELRQVIWLRALDLRLLRALAKVKAMQVEVEFYFMPPEGSSYRSFRRLLSVTEDALKRDPRELIWARFIDLQEDGGPLAGLAQDFMEPALKLSDPQGVLSLERVAGRYMEAENLVRRALRAIEQGVEPHQIVMAFPDLSLYGQMAADAAKRLGLPLGRRYSQLLSKTPLFRDLATLLRLPISGYPRQELGRVIDSAYVGACLADMAGVAQPKGAARLLAKAGYVEMAEGSAPSRLSRAKAFDRGNIEKYEAISVIYDALTGLLNETGLDGGPLDPGGFASRVGRLINKLGLRRQLLSARLPAGFEATIVDDLLAEEAVEAQLARFAQATQIAGVTSSLGFGRLVSLLEDAFGELELTGRSDQPFGVRLLRLDQAVGLEPKVLLIGGLNQGEFPQRPAGRNLLSTEERKALGGASEGHLPVWRVEEEEYSGQVLRLLWLMASARESVNLSCCAADAAGHEVQPSNILTSLALRLGTPLRTIGEGVFGDLPELEECLDDHSLRVRLAADLLRPGAKGSDLAQAVLFHKTDGRPAAHQRWRAIAERAAGLVHQDQMNLYSIQERLPAADAFSGKIVHQEALQLIDMVMDQGFRTWSPTSLEQYASCPMSWFFIRLLKIAPVDAPDWSIKASGEGRWVHETLSLFFDPTDFKASWSPEDVGQRLSWCLDRAQAMLAETGEAGHPMIWAVRREVIYARLIIVIGEELANMGKLRPVGVEREIEPRVLVELEDGGALQLEGRIDRLDSGGRDLRVVDYKHTSDHSSLGRAVKEEHMAVDAFQVPVYLAGAAQMAEPGLETLEARLVNTKRPANRSKRYELKAGAILIAADRISRQKAREQSQINLFNAVEDLWKSIIGGNFVAAPDRIACTWCGYSRVCRATMAISGEESS